MRGHHGPTQLLAHPHSPRRACRSARRPASGALLRLRPAGPLRPRRRPDPPGRLRRDRRLYTFVEGNEPINMALTTANTIQHTASVLRRIAPDWMMTIADRYETLGTAVAAAYAGVPLIHVQGGEITGNIDEKVRHAVTKLADVHFVANTQAQARVRQMGEHPSSVHVTGCPSIDIAREAMAMPIEEVQAAIDALGVGTHVDLRSDFLVVLQHPETDSYDHSYERMSATLDAVAEVGVPTIIFWPNVDAGSDATSKAIRVFRESGRFQKAHYIKNLEGHLFLRLLEQSRCLIGNSSVGIRECSYMGTPVINLGDRQHGRERGSNVIDCDWDALAIRAAIETQLKHGRYPSSTIYGDGYAGERIARMVQGLTKTTTKRFHEA
ncbi:UDP-N-acetylglucosamine 2-epimerase [Rhizobacter sp. J219]|uniref:UDP-N-acetylglucosamine 2-epimerase n=1 Tax=Rhizobacter sp. J219 TaxID=2898430 RepID=UPI00215171C1|nr:UDP-N-acetylglucosamine 2-epimerase [Rhizobacter sp. J219]